MPNDAFQLTTTPPLTEWPALLLPLRLEVRRIGIELCIRVFPDQPFVDTHQEQLTQEEHDAGLPLYALVAALGDPCKVKDLEGEDLEAARGEWKELARRFGPNRAAWILQSLLCDKDAPVASTQSDFIPRLFLLPQRFIFLIYKDGALAYQEAGVDLRDTLTLLPARTVDKTAGKDGLFDASSRWITDFQDAVNAGLGIRICLNQADRTATALRFSHIVVVGLRDGGHEEGRSALQKFVDHHHFTEGGLEFLSYETPTNNTAETQSGHSQSEEELLASFDHEVQSPMWTLSDLRRRQTASHQFARALGLGSMDPLTHIKGADLVPHGGFPETLKALWGSTGDHIFHLLNYGKSTARELLLEHAADYLRPRGLLASIRIGNQPYGVLPATRIRAQSEGDSSGWKSSLHDARNKSQGTEWLAFDNGLHRALSALLPRWLARANDWSVVPRVGMSGDSDEELLKILGMSPNSLDYRVRPMVDHKLIGVLIMLFHGLYFGVNSAFADLGDEITSVNAWVAEKQRINALTVTLLRDMGAEAGVANELLLRMFAWGEGTDLYMPLVRDPAVDAPSPENYLKYLIDTGPTAAAVSYADALLYDLVRRSMNTTSWPDSLEPLLTIVTRLFDYPVVEFFNNTVTADSLTSIDSSVDSSSFSRDFVDNLNEGRPAGGYTNAATIRGLFSTNFGDASIFDSVAARLREGFESRLEDWLRDTIDVLTYRLDAWFTTLPTKRLDLMRVRNPIGLLWGAYGYLEDINIPPATLTRGQPDSGGGFIHAPSVAHASAAAMLRSAFDTHRSDANGNAYALNLTSTRVNRALALIDGVQQGQELGALLGYQFERGLHDAALDRFIDDFRADFPIAAPDEADSDAPGENVAARDVVDGRALADAYAANDSTLLTKVGAAPTTVSEILRDLVETNDALGDLLLYEGIFQAVQGNYERSGAALDACAGMAKPPEIESAATPIGGNTLRHRLCVVLPADVPTDPSAPAPPGERAKAESRLNAWGGNILGPLGNIGCRIYARAGAESDEVPHPVTLGELQPPISHLDFIYMCSVLPEGNGDTEIEMRLRRRVRTRENLTASTTLRIAFDELDAEPPADTSVLADAMEVARAILDFFGNATVLSPQALTDPDDVPDNAVFSGADVTDFWRRANSAKTVLDTQRHELEVGTASEVLQALDTCSAFGIQEALLAGDGDPSLDDRKAATIRVIDKRIAAATPLLSAGSDDGGDERIASLIGAFKALFGEEFVALPSFSAPVLPDLTLDTRIAVFDDSTIASPPPDEERIWLWLEQVADTHPRVRALESLFMAAQAWGVPSANTNFAGFKIAQLPLRPQYGWQALSDLELNGAGGRARGTQSIVAMLPEEFNSNLRGFLIDEWTETMAAPTVSTGVSFEYNQPASQAPQCLLLAIPGSFDNELWTAEHLAGIVRDTMDLAKIRLVDLDALPDVAGLFPALFFRVGSTGSPQSPGTTPLGEVMDRASPYDLADRGSEYVDAL